MFKAEILQGERRSGRLAHARIRTSQRLSTPSMNVRRVRAELPSWNRGRPEGPGW